METTNYQQQLQEVQTNIEDVNTRILLLQLQRERYEQMGHRLVALMLGIDDGK